MKYAILLAMNWSLRFLWKTVLPNVLSFLAALFILWVIYAVAVYFGMR